MTEEQVAEVQPQSLNPFGFMPGVTSRIAGLVGGSMPGHDPYYVFHTPYVNVARGRAHFTLRFANLRAKRGTLVIRVNMFPPDAGAVARLVNSERIALSRLVNNKGGEIEIAFEAYRGMLYAVYGQILDDTDAVADGLEVLLDRPDDGSELAGAVADARSTIFSTDRLKPTARLLSTEPATLENPVSQMCTAAQLEEATYARWLGELGMAHHRHRKQWEHVYILQVLDRYGALRPGARGVGFGCGQEWLPAAMAARGCEIVATDLHADDAASAAWHATGQHGAEREALRFPALCDDAVFERNVSFRPADMTAIPRDLVNFDFCWSSCAYEHLGSIDAGLRFVEESLETLRPGGLAVHTSELNLTSNDDTLDNCGTVLFRRRDMERLALTLISRGHEVAQIKLDTGDRPLDSHIDMPPYSEDPHLKMALGRYATTSFGIIVRKARQPI